MLFEPSLDLGGIHWDTIEYVSCWREQVKLGWRDLVIYYTYKLLQHLQAQNSHLITVHHGHGHYSMVKACLSSTISTPCWGRDREDLEVVKHVSLLSQISLGGSHVTFLAWQPWGRWTSCGSGYSGTLIEEAVNLLEPWPRNKNSITSPAFYWSKHLQSLPRVEKRR